MKSVKIEGLDDFNPFSSDLKILELNAPKESETNSRSINETTSLLLSKIKEKPRKNSGILENENISPIEKSWPKFSSILPCQSCFNINIPEDIPDRMKKTVITAFYIWLSYTLGMILNVFGTMAYFISVRSMESGSTFGSSLFLLFIIPILGFLLWFKSLYKAAQSDNSIQYFVFFIAMFGQIVVISIQCIGIDWLGSCGWINSIVVFTHHKTSGSIMMLIAVMFTVMLIGHIFLLSNVHQRYRNSEILQQPFYKNSNDQTLNSTSLREIATFSVKRNSNFVMDEIKHEK